MTHNLFSELGQHPFCDLSATLSDEERSRNAQVSANRCDRVEPYGLRAADRAVGAELYWWLDTAQVPYANAKNVFIFSVQGRFGGAIKLFPVDRFELFHSTLQQPLIVQDDFGQIAGSTWIQFLRVPSAGYTELHIPYWIPALLTALLATAPWIRWSRRFSLRMLLIATTLVAVVLGIIVLAT